MFLLFSQNCHAISNPLVVPLFLRDVVERGKSFRNLADVRMVEPGHLTAYDVLWSNQVVFTSHTVGSVGRGSKYEVTESDFVKESTDGGEEE